MDRKARIAQADAAPKKRVGNMKDLYLEPMSLSKLVDGMHTRGNVEDILDEYRQLCARDHCFPHDTMDEYPSLNRYPDILVWDYSRVKVTLRGTGKDADCDFINANWVPGGVKDEANKSCKYIVMQGPMKDTVEKVWLMAWEHGVRLFVGLCKMGAGRCDFYVPRREGEVLRLGTVNVDCVYIYHCDGYEAIVCDVVYKPEGVTNDDMKRRVVVLLHYSWEDRCGMPLASLNYFIKVMNQCHRQMRALAKKEEGLTDTMPSPIIVHCSAGVGRSGTLVAMDIITDMLRYEKTVSIAMVVLRLRFHRHQMVQRPLQYLMLYLGTLDLAMKEGFMDPMEIHPERVFLHRADCLTEGSVSEAAEDSAKSAHKSSEAKADNGKSEQKSSEAKDASEKRSEGEGEPENN